MKMTRLRAIFRNIALIKIWGDDKIESMHRVKPSFSQSALRNGRYKIFYNAINVKGTRKLNQARFIVFDVETPNRYNNRISAIGITVIENQSVTDRFFSYVNPQTFFDPFNTKLTGISESTVAAAPSFPELWRKIEPIMSGGILVAHNAQFDLGVLKKCLNDYGIIWKNEAQYCCTVQMGRKLLPGMGHGLNTMCDYYGIELNHHQADSDSMAAAMILLRYMEGGAQAGRFVKKYRFDGTVNGSKGKTNGSI